MTCTQAMSDLTIPDFLDRKKTPRDPATAEERAAFVKQPTIYTQSRMCKTDAELEALAADEKAKRELEQQEQQRKAAKTCNRISRLKANKERDAIPEKFRAWDVRTCKFYDIRKQKEKPIMTTKPKATKAAKPKPTPHTKRGGSKREALIAMLKRPHGASLGELLKANPLSGKTPLATISAMVSVIKRDHKIERVGDGKGAGRRYRIIAERVRR